MWEKEKLLVTSNFSFSHNVFKSCHLLMCQNEYLWSKGLTSGCKGLSANMYRLPNNIILDHRLSSLKTKGFVDYTCINPIPKKPWFFTCLRYKSFENTVGKGEIARNEEFLLFPQCFLPIWKTFCHFH